MCTHCRFFTRGCALLKWHYNSIDPATWKSWNGSLSCPVRWSSVKLELAPQVFVQRGDLLDTAICSLICCNTACRCPTARRHGCKRVSEQPGWSCEVQHYPGARCSPDPLKLDTMRCVAPLCVSSVACEVSTANVDPAERSQLLEVTEAVLLRAPTGRPR